jgi:predicted metal-dependent hydrolase
MAPPIVLRYVIIHELVHTTEKNHSAIFWNKVRKYNPSYKAQIKWLKENGNGLMLE